MPPSRRFSPGLSGLLESLVAILLAVMLSSGVLVLLGHAPVPTWRIMVERTLLRPSGLQEIAVHAAPLLIVGIAVLIATNAGVWNIGVDGQILVAALSAAVAADALVESSRVVMWLGALVAALIAGGVWVLVPAILRARYGINEIVITIMLNYVAVSLTAWLVKGALRDESLVTPQTSMIPRELRYPVLADTRVHMGVVFALILWVGFVWWMSRSESGFNLRAVGESPRAAKFAMISVSTVIFVAFVASGAIAGLAGANDILATKGTFQAEWNPGYGLTAFALVFLARKHPLGLLPAALFLGWVAYASDIMPRAADVPSSFFTLFEGVLLMVLGVWHWQPWQRLEGHDER